MTAKYSRQNFCCGKVKKGQEKHFGRLSHNFLCDHLLLDVILADCNKLLYLSDLFDGRISYSALQPISARFPSAAARSWNVFEQNVQGHLPYLVNIQLLLFIKKQNIKNVWYLLLDIFILSLHIICIVSPLIRQGQNVYQMSDIVLSFNNNLEENLASMDSIKVTTFITSVLKEASQLDDLFRGTPRAIHCI